MNEDFLYYIWQYKLFSTSNLITSTKQEIQVKKTGMLNTNSGPDFLNAQIEIDTQLWVGNVEMHLKSSDWYLHKHEEDINYDAVILHVVWEHDTDVFMKNNTPLPTLEIKNFISKSVLQNYTKLVFQKQNWIPCGNQIENVESFLIDNWLERLYFERLENKSVFIKKLLAKTNDDYEAVLFKLLAKSFGLKVNGDAFLQLTNSIDFSVVRKVRFDDRQLSALFFGQAGFLEDKIEDVYFEELKNEYNYLKHKYKLQSISKNTFQFFRMRPHNFPTIRIAQLASLFFKHQKLFSKLISVHKKEEFYKLFSITLNEFWQTHYTFEKNSNKTTKKLTKSFIDLLLINTIIPLKFVYLQSRGDVDEQEFISLIKQISSEKNSIITKFMELNISPKNAMESQSLLELKNNYCTKKRCLHCAIGNNLLRK